MDFVDQYYYLELAAAFCRGRLGLDTATSREEAIEKGREADLRLHKFKRNAELPRVRRVLGVLRGFCPNSVLDVGSGRGVFLFPLLEQHGALPITACDLSQQRASDLGALARGGVSRLTAYRADTCALPFEDGRFDIVTLLEVLEHLTLPSAAAKETLRVARRAVIVSVPSRVDDNPEHIHLFDRTRLVQLFTAAGAAKVSVEGVLNHFIVIATV